MTPTLDGTTELLQLARNDFEQRFPTHDIFHHKCPFHTSTTNITHLSFRFDQFVELPSIQLFGCPHFMLTSLPVV